MADAGRHGEQPGWRLRGYEVLDRIGAGASGEVWRARHRGSGDVVAVKRMAVPDRDELARVHTEAAVLGALDHPHLVRLREVVRAASSIVLVFEFAHRGSLARLLATRGRLSTGEVITAVVPVAAAVAYVHRAGVVHGDISPANIVFTGAGLPLLVDLGRARLAGDATGGTVCGTVCGTPGYADPAVTRGDLPVPASDVYGLGAVALHALTGAVLPAACVDERDEARARLEAAAVPAPVADVVLRALAPDPPRRPPAAEFATDLQHAAIPVAVEFDARRALDHVPCDPPFTHRLRPQPRPAVRRVRFPRRRLRERQPRRDPPWAN